LLQQRIVGVGVDVVEVGRLARLRGGRRDVLGHVCRPEELVGAIDDDRAASLWSGKEAVAKAIGTGLWQAGVDWKDIAIDRASRVTLWGEAARLAGATRVEVAFARRGTLMVAVAVRREAAP